VVVLSERRRHHRSALTSGWVRNGSGVGARAAIRPSDREVTGATDEIGAASGSGSLCTCPPCSESPHLLAAAGKTAARFGREINADTGAPRPSRTGGLSWWTCWASTQTPLSKTPSPISTGFAARWTDRPKRGRRPNPATFREPWGVGQARQRPHDGKGAGSGCVPIGYSGIPTIRTGGAHSARSVYHFAKGTSIRSGLRKHNERAPGCEPRGLLELVVAPSFPATVRWIAGKHRAVAA
jgi:hypothetical protein